MLYGVRVWDMVVVQSFDVGQGGGLDVTTDVDGRVMWDTVMVGGIRGRLYGIRAQDMVYV